MNFIKIPDKTGWKHVFDLKFYDGRTYNRYEVKDVCIIDVSKRHDHRYDMRAFFYDKKIITYQENIRSKKELYSAIQKLLQEILNVAVQ